MELKSSDTEPCPFGTIAPVDCINNDNDGRRPDHTYDYRDYRNVHGAYAYCQIYLKADRSDRIFIQVSERRPVNEMPPITIDPHIVPWSYRGSYLCLATRSGEGGRLTPANNDVCLISHIYPAGLPLCALRPQLPGHEVGRPTGFHKDPSPVDFSATPASLTWTHDGEVVAEATFQDVRTIRIRGNLPFSFDTEGSLEVDAWRNWLFRVPPTSTESRPVVEFTSRPDSALLFTALDGQLKLENEAPSQDNNRRITILPCEGHSTWELEIHEREREFVEASGIRSGEEAKDRSFESVKNRMADVFDTYAKDLCPWQNDWSSPAGQTDQLGAYVTWTSTVRPAGYFKKEAILMSKLWMNKVSKTRVKMRQSRQSPS